MLDRRDDGEGYTEWLSQRWNVNKKRGTNSQWQLTDRHEGYTRELFIVEMLNVGQEGGGRRERRGKHLSPN